MIEMNGLNKDAFPVNVPTWSVSTMLIAGTVIWGLLYYYKGRFRNFFMPLSIVVVLGVWANLEILTNSKWHVLFTAGMMRTWIEMCLGYYCLRLAEKITAQESTRKRKVILALIELLCYVVIAFEILHGTSRWHQLATLFIMIPAVAIAVSEQSVWQDVLGTAIGKLRIPFAQASLSIYLIHYSVFMFFKYKYGSAFIDADRTPYLVKYLVCVALAAVVYYFCTKWLIKAFRKMAVPWKRFWTGA